MEPKVGVENKRVERCAPTLKLTSVIPARTKPFQDAEEIFVQYISLLKKTSTGLDLSMVSDDFTSGHHRRTYIGK
jgi:hypothetical protein